MDSIPTGSFTLDRALGIGGVPKGRITELIGDTQRLALSLVTQAQAKDNVVAWVDCPQKLDLREVREAGVNCSRMLLSQPDDQEQARDVAEALLRSQQLGLVVLDTPPQWDSRTWRKLLSLAEQTQTALVCLTSGDGRALRFYASVVLETRGTQAKALRNRYAPPRTCEVVWGQEDKDA